MNTVCQKLSRLMVHGLAWAICIGSNTACVYAIYWFSDHMHKVRRGRFKVQNLTFTMAQKFYRQILQLQAVFVGETIITYSVSFLFQTHHLSATWLLCSKQ